MKREEIINYVNFLEKKYPVNTWKLNGIHVWPFIRFRLGMTLMTHFEGANIIKEGRKTVANTSKLRKFKAAIINFLHAVQIIVNLKKVNYLFFTASNYRVKKDEKNMCRFCDPMLDSLERNNEKGYILDYKGLHKNNDLYKPERNIDFIIIGKALFPFFFRLFKGKKKFELTSYSEFFMELGSMPGFEGEHLQFSLENVKKELEWVLFYSLIWEIILKRTRPKFIFEICYYGHQIMGLNWAAANLRIPTVEIQHGSQGELHIAYGSWTNVPKTGYKLLPKIFWNWDKYSLKVIQASFSESTYHKWLLGRNPWCTFWELESTLKERQWNLDDVKQIILYTTQPTGSLFPPELVDYIKKSAKEYTWFIRVHPRQFIEMDEILDELKCLGLLDKVNVNEASNLPLPYLLKKTKFHITKYSGSVIEAANFNVPSIVIDELGKKTFSEFINQGKVIFMPLSSLSKFSFDDWKPETDTIDVLPYSSYDNYVAEIMRKLRNLNFYN